MWKVALLLWLALTAPARAEPSTAIVSFTFDDAPKSVMTIGLPLMRQAGYPATVYVTTLNTSFDGYLNWDDIRVLVAAGWEVGAHTHTHPDLTTLSSEAIAEEFETSNRLYAEQGYRPTTFATPLGAYDERVLAIIRRYYSSHRTAWPAGVSTLDPDPYAIVSYGVDRDTTIEEIAELLENLQKRGGWVVFQLHHLFPEGEVVEKEFGTNLLGAIIEQVKAKNLAVLTVGDALQELKKE